MEQIAIKSSRIVTPRGVKSGVLLIMNGTIVDVVQEVPGDYVLEDAGDNVVMPGIIDPHVHINEPGRTEWEGFDTATKAALAGGITLLADMPLNSSPVTTTVEALNKKREAAIGKIHTNCMFWGGVVPGNEKDIWPLIQEDIPGFKAFLTHSGIDEFPNVTEADLEKVMPIIEGYEIPLLVHCELESPVSSSGNIGHSYQAYLSSRPEKWENDAIALMIRLCEKFNCPVHIVHLSSASSIEQIRIARENGLPLTVETAQHYLYFNAEEIPDGQTAYKCAPPIRDKANNEQLWQALKDGIIDFVATDHSPAPPDMKQLESGDLGKAWGGIASIQFALPVLWTAAKERGCDLVDVSKWLSTNPAKLPGMDSIKGRIEQGYDADLVIWNPEEKFTVTEDIILHRHKITPYLGHELYGVVKQTWLGGHKVFDNGVFTALNKGDIYDAG